MFLLRHRREWVQSVGHGGNMEWGGSGGGENKAKNELSVRGWQKMKIKKRSLGWAGVEMGPGAEHSGQGRDAVACILA